MLIVYALTIGALGELQIRLGSGGREGGGQKREEKRKIERRRDVGRKRYERRERERYGCVTQVESITVVSRCLNKMAVCNGP